MTIPASGLFISVCNHWLSSFVLCCSDTVRATQQTAAAEQSSYCYMCCSTNCSRDTLSESGYKQKEMEGNCIPPMPVMLTKKWKCKQRVWFTGRARNEHDKIKLIAYLQYIHYIQYIEYIEYIQYIQYIQNTQCIQYTQYIQYIQHPGEKRKKRTKEN